MGSVSVSSCICSMFVFCVHPVAVLHIYLHTVLVIFLHHMHVVVVCLPRHMEGMGRLQFSDLFSQNCQFHHRRLESLEHFNVLDIYPSEHYGFSFFGPYGCCFFTRSLFFVYLSILQVHFACVLCI